MQVWDTAEEGLSFGGKAGVRLIRTVENKQVSF